MPSLIKPSLGPLESEVLGIVCKFGESSGRQVVKRLTRPLAYTTVMTTLSRLYNKGFLNCRVCGKSFFYTSRLTEPQIELQLARDLVRRLVQCERANASEIAAIIKDELHREDRRLHDELQRAMKDT
jgi:predicted transcriptional regulator